MGEPLDFESALRAATPPAEDAAFLLAVLDRIERRAGSRSRGWRLLKPAALLSALGLGGAMVQSLRADLGIDVQLAQISVLAVGSALVTAALVQGWLRRRVGGAIF